jgi:26S proteasome regulatory subunit N3
LKQESIALAIAGKCCCAWNSQDRWALSLPTLTLRSPSTDIKNNFNFLERAVESIESRFTTRVLRTTTSIRKRLTPHILTQVINDYFGEGDCRL